MQIKTALISVYDKTGIVELAKKLSKLGVKIISTGGTAELLKKNRINVVSVSDYTGSDEILDGRVKTLNPKIFGGILALRENEKHIKQLEERGIDNIDIVVVNLYPFEEIIKKGPKLDEALENIDIGGPSLIRAAAKNFRHVAVIVKPSDYGKIIKELEKGGLSEKTRKELAVKAFRRAADYNAEIDKYLSKELLDENVLRLNFVNGVELRYGENPHQKGIFYKDQWIIESCISSGKQLHGKQLSYNNILDSDVALEIVKEFERPAAAIIKHVNPCGVASAPSIDGAFKKAHEVDTLSAFGSVIALNRPCNREIAELIKDIFVEVLACPRFEKDAMKILTQKKNIRLIETGSFMKKKQGYEFKSVTGGLLLQTKEYPELKLENLKPVTKRKIEKSDFDDIVFSYKVNKHVKSNSIVLIKNQVMVGIGAGHTSRVKAVQIAVEKAGEKSKDSILNSDAFFPFRDGIDEAAKGKVRAIIQPGGSIRDQEAIDACNEHSIAMAFTGIRLFRH